MAEKTESRSSLVEALTSFSPWSSRSATPKPYAGSDSEKDKSSEEKKFGNVSATNDASSSILAGVGTQRGRDHTISHWHSLSSKNYPKDCPRLNVQWFHAVDVALRKPNYGGAEPEEPKPPPAPKKWAAFSVNDSKAIEGAFQKLSEAAEEEARTRGQNNVSGEIDEISAKLGDRTEDSEDHQWPSTTVGESFKTESSAKVPVNEDYLFDVDIKNRELGPAYWLGPVYSVRRGTWFYVDGTSLRPCDETLALQLEEGYIKMKPWRLPKTEDRSSSPSQLSGDGQGGSSATDKVEAPKSKPPPQATSSSLTYRLFGSHMNHIVTYQDETTAWILSDDFLSRMSSSMYQRFAGGAHLSGTKVLRGFQKISKKRGAKDSLRPTTPTKSPRTNSPLPSEEGPKNSASAESGAIKPQSSEEGESALKSSETEENEKAETRVQFLERQMSNLVVYQQDPSKQDEEAQRREEQEIRDDYKDTPGDAQDREIEHLVLVTHGIGQRLGARFETFNFIHDVNELRKTLKSVYGMSADLQALNGELETIQKNCRVQVLPICWRHLLDFPLQSLKKHNRREFDPGDNAEDDEVYPGLADITIDGVPALRNIIADLALDVLLYQNQAYHDHISRVVAKECNRILLLFKQRNPYFNGKVSLIGHSLGSAVLFDLLSIQESEKYAFEKPSKSNPAIDEDMKLDFGVDNLICFGSPIGLFQMLNGKTISGRMNPNQVTLDGAEAGIEDPIDEASLSELIRKAQKQPTREVYTSSPKCKQLFNIFHPTDPISYRLEPLISPVMSTLPPQNLPYTKNSFLGAPMGHGITGIPARVGQSFTGLWTSFSSGIANNFINRSLGISAEDAIKMGAPPSISHSRNQSQQSAGAGTNSVGGGVISTEALPPHFQQHIHDERRHKLAQDTAEAHNEGEHPPTLIDSDMETLYSQFQKRRKSEQGNDSSQSLTGSNSLIGTEEREIKMKREEARVRALNSNGRVDYSIQEGAFDISFLQSIASHLTYWTDEDVCHFLVSQLLARKMR